MWADMTELDYLGCDGPTVSNMWTGLVCVFNRTPSLGCVVTRTECSSSRSGFYWFIYHWATVEDDPGLQTFGLWALLLSLLRDPLTFPTHRPGSSSELEGVCVCVPPSSAWGQMRLMESSPVGSGPTICCVAGPSVSAALAAFGLFSVWECERNLRWHAADRLTWESGAFLWGDRSICQVTMRLSHLENQPWVSHCPVYIIFICSVHMLTNLSEAGTSSLFTRLNY